MQTIYHNSYCIQFPPCATHCTSLHVLGPVTDRFFAASDLSGDTERLSYRAASTLLPRMHGSGGTSGHSDKSQKPLECASAYNPAL